MKRFHDITCGLLVALSSASGCSDNLTLPPERDAYEAAELEPLACVPNLDERIEAHEMRAGIGVPVSFRISPAQTVREVDIAGAKDQEGIRVWDWSRDDADDRALELQAAALADQWYARAFEGGEFVTLLDAAGRLEAVYSQTEAGIYLHGYASAEEEPPEGQTRVVYQEPVTVYRFPLEPDSEWVSVGEVRNATIRGLPYAGTDTYDFKVDGTGELWLPDLRFEQAFRVRTHVTISPAVGESTSRRQVSFVFECFGEVARATSRDGEENENFSVAEEVRRLGL